MAIYAVDFDGTLAYTKFPEIIQANDKMIAFVKTLKAMGHKVILWTSRTGRDLQDAVEWCRKQGLIFDSVNKPLPEQVARWGNDTRKIYADYYIDDKAVTLKEAEDMMDQIMEVAGELEEGLKPSEEPAYKIDWLGRIPAFARRLIGG